MQKITLYLISWSFKRTFDALKGSKNSKNPQSKYLKIPYIKIQVHQNNGKLFNIVTQYIRNKMSLMRFDIEILIVVNA